MKKSLFNIFIIFILLFKIPSEESKIIGKESFPVFKEDFTLKKYGFYKSDFEIENEKIKKRENLSIILSKKGISVNTIDKIVEKSKGVFDLKKMRVGRNYSFFVSNDEKELKHFVYEISKTKYVIFDLQDSLEVKIFKRKTNKVLKTVSGIIESSLWNSMKAKGLNTIMATELAEIYAWSIDFFRLEKGDFYKIIYEELQLKETNEIVGIGEIKAVQFQHKKEDFFAFSYLQDGIENFFDEKGLSLKKPFLKAPLKFGTVTSGYSKRRYHPILKRVKAHLGTDYGAPRGTPIMSTGDGVVTKASYGRGNGRYVKIRHSSTYQTQYLHMSKFAKGIKIGVYVKQGDVIGYVGSTGLSTGPHVCYRFWKNGHQVDPRKQKFPKSTRIKAKDMDNFIKNKNISLEKLNNIFLKDFS